MSVHHAAPVTPSTIVVAVDVGKCSAVLSVTNSQRSRLLGPIGFELTCSGMSAVVELIDSAIESSTQVKLAVEAAGHYHRPVLDYGWPPGWEVLELNPAHVAEQRRVAGRRRVKTDAIDLEAITELVLAGRDNRRERRRSCWVRSGRGRPIVIGGLRCVRRRRISYWPNSTARFPG